MHDDKSDKSRAFDIHRIRATLNELPFKDGKREVLVGRISELWVNELFGGMAHLISHPFKMNLVWWSVSIRCLRCS